MKIFEKPSPANEVIFGYCPPYAARLKRLWKPGREYWNNEPSQLYVERNDSRTRAEREISKFADLLIEEGIIGVQGLRLKTMTRRYDNAQATMVCVASAVADGSNSETSPDDRILGKLRVINPHSSLITQFDFDARRSISRDIGPSFELTNLAMVNPNTGNAFGPDRYNIYEVRELYHNFGAILMDFHTRTQDVHPEVLNSVEFVTVPPARLS